MSSLRLLSSSICIVLLFGTGAAATATAACPQLGMKQDPAPPSNLLPGSYFEYRARSYLKQDEPASALGMYKLAAYWGNKYAQYNIGILYFVGGKSIAPDRARAAAWLRLAAGSQQPGMTDAFQKVLEALTPAERAQADIVWNELQTKYADTLTRQRVITRYQTERRNVTGSRVGFVGSLTLCLPDGSEADGYTYYKQMDKVFETYVDTMFGHATVGPLVPISEPAPKK